MYIRRKVFSLLHDETGEERYFSTSEINLEDTEERIYSVEDEEKGKRSKLARNIALGSAGAAALLYGGSKIGSKKAFERARKYMDEVGKAKNTADEIEALRKHNKYFKLGDIIGKPSKFVDDLVPDSVKNGYSKLTNRVRDAYEARNLKAKVGKGEASTVDFEKARKFFERRAKNK